MPDSLTTSELARVKEFIMPNYAPFPPVSCLYGPFLYSVPKRTTCQALVFTFVDLIVYICKVLLGKTLDLH
jgi:hypothetical protein